MTEINIIKSTNELAQMMKSNRSFIEKSELSIGQDFLSLFQDELSQEATNAAIYYLTTVLAKLL